MMTMNEKERKRLIKKIHVLYGRLKMTDDGREAFLSAWGAAHTDELSTGQLMEACNKLDMRLNPELAELDRWRKRVMAAAGGWLRSRGLKENADYIKAVACRAAGKERFNGIPLATLRNLYYEFLNKRKTHGEVSEIDGKVAFNRISPN
jgi:hypothetical protein